MMRKSLCAASLLALSGCTPTVRESFTATALERAAFETGCPKDKVEFVPLNGTLDDYALDGKTVGVTACGKKAVYVYTIQGGWILNSHTENPPATDTKENAKPEGGE